MGLKELLGEELYNTVTAAVKGKGKDGKDLDLIVNDGNYIPRIKFNEVNDKVKVLEADIATRDTQIKTLGESVKGNADLTKQITDLTAINAKAKADYDSKIKDIQITTAAEKALTAAQAKHVDLLMSKVDRSKLVIDNDKIIGLDEQVTTLKETYKDLFGETRVTGRTESTSPGSTGAPVDAEVEAFKNALGL